jgi:potassium-transporting ATPase KdpC subunit
VRREIQSLLTQNASAPFGGLIGPNLINVLEVNMTLRARYGAPPA